MTEFANDQAHLDADVQALGDITASIETEIANLKQQEQANGVDFSGLDAALDRLRGVAPSAPAAEQPAPAPTQTEPVSTDSAGTPASDNPEPSA